MKLVVFEGVDRSGKSTLAKEFNKQTNFKHIVVDRAFLSQAAYSIIYNREKNLDSILSMIRKLGNDLVVVYVTASKETIEKRLLESNHEKINLEFDTKMFDFFYDLISCKKITINTDNKPVSDNINKIIKFIEEEKCMM